MKLTKETIAEYLLSIADDKFREGGITVFWKDGKLDDMDGNYEKVDLKLPDGAIPVLAVDDFHGSVYFGQDASIASMINENFIIDIEVPFIKKDVKKIKKELDECDLNKLIDKLDKMNKEYDISQFKSSGDILKKYKTKQLFQQTWENCPRGDWMLWVAFKLGVNEKKRTLVKGHCANTVRHLMKDKQSRDAVDAAIAYGQGKIDEKKLNKFASIACPTVSANTDIYKKYKDSCNFREKAVYDAAFFAASLIDVCGVINEVVIAASSAACDANNDGTAHVDYNSTKISANKKLADICRKYLTKEVETKYIKKLLIEKKEKNHS